MLRLSPADCLIGDLFPCPKEAGNSILWFYLPTIELGVNEEFPPITDDWPHRWYFHRARWTSDSGPFVLDVLIRKS
jgi:hypothetical protein